MQPNARPGDGVDPLPAPQALGRLGHCARETARLMVGRKVHLSERNLDRRIAFTDGSIGRVYRETTADVDTVGDPVTLVVGFRLRWVGGQRMAHTLFRAESICNTPLFVGFPGFVSKLWLAHDQHNLYRGVYEWDGARRANDYVRALWWALAVVSDTSSIRYHIVAGSHRDQTLSDPPDTAAGQWWRPMPAGGDGPK